MISPDKAVMFRNRLTKVYRHISRLARKQGVSCYRIYDHDLPEFPFCIEQYEDWLYVAEYRRRHAMAEDAHAEWMEDCKLIIGEITQVSPARIVFRTRQRKPGRQDQYQKLGESAQYLEVSEQGLKFRINLTDYLDTGLFLDHRVTRNLVRQISYQKKVLNLFCYTGSFSVYAAAGGATEVHSVDLSRTYLQWAAENLRLNSLSDEARHPFVQADVVQWLSKSPPGYFDLIVMDPPTFSNSKRMEDFLDIQRDHPSLINQALHLLKPDGILIFSTNFSRFEMKGSEVSGLIKDITRATTPFDFQGKLQRYCFEVRPSHPSSDG